MKIEEEENTIPNWAEVPDDLMELISSNLYGENRVAFGRVCRSWNSIFTTYTEHNAPRLMFYYSIQHCWRFSQYKGFSDKEFPQLDNAEIRCSKYGWLLMSRDDFSLFFFNPFTERIRELPKYEYPYSIICFFNEPTSSNCIVFGISSSTDEIVIDVLKQGNDEWEMNLFMCESEYHLSYCSPVMHHGSLYLLDTKGDVSVFDPNGNDPIWYVYNECLFPPRLTHKIKQQFLIKEQEELLAVFVSNEERKVSVYRMELIEDGLPRWKLLKDLGQKVLFVSHTAAFARNALYKSMGNRIYFNIFYQNTIVYYCLNTHKYYSSIHNNNFSTNKSYGLKQLDFATWIMPHS